MPLLLLLAALAPAGQTNEWFFLQSDDGNFVLLPSGRFQMDLIAGQAGTPAAGFLPKRARLEAFGTLLHHVDYQLGAEFTFATAPVSTDEVIILDFTHWARLQLGQYDAPFTMENRTSDKYFDLQERANSVRAFAFPENKMVGAMIWGTPEERWAYWSVGLFNGDGINAYPNKDDRLDLVGRAWLAPLWKNVWLGGSFWTGEHRPTTSSQIDRISMKDQAGFTFFDTKGLGLFGQVTKWGLELNAPVGPFVIKAEWLHGSEELRELPSLRTGTLSGDGGYARVSWFPFGDPLINGLGGAQYPPHPLDDSRPSKLEPALQLVAQLDHVGFSYDSPGSPFAGKFFLDSATLGANYWWTRHLRLTLNFIRNWFGGPGARPMKGHDDNFEITGRVAVAL